MADELNKIKSILEANKNKSFVKRILSPKKYPKIDLGDGVSATHLLAWSQVGDKYHVYPTILWDGRKLTEYESHIAHSLTRKTGNYIEFDTPEEADWFSKRYKLVWEKE